MRPTIAVSPSTDARAAKAQKSPTMKSPKAEFRLKVTVTPFSRMSEVPGGGTVRRDVVVLVTEPRAGTRDAGLYLVEHEQRPGVVAQPAQAREIAGARDDDAGTGLSR